MKDLPRLQASNFDNLRIKEHTGKSVVFFQRIGALIVFLSSIIGMIMEMLNLPLLQTLQMLIRNYGILLI